MGFFGTYLFTRGGWSQHEPEQVPSVAAPWLLISIHDSDFTLVHYHPAGPGTGEAYLGYTPRAYFGDAAASAATDPAREASGLAAWWATQTNGIVSPEEREAKAAELADYLARDEMPDQAPTAEEVLDDAEVFVEIKTSRFLAALGLPVPEDLPQ